ncbi:hypothetical protein F4810DRAFT_372401 [Camillea tinctor]|nr:hypothetical protein F4810DRAFT_372401 [Camillea tinctor]
MMNRPTPNISTTGQSSETCTFRSERSGPSEDEIGRKPWKFIGYKGYAKFIASEEDFYIVRRFDALNVRVALSLQDEISVLEEQLSQLDNLYSQRDADDVNNGTFRDDLEDRTSLMITISERLYHYNKFMLQQSSLRNYSTAPHRDIKSIRNWHHNYDYAAISPDEQKYLDHEDDLFCVVQKQKTPLRRMIDSSRRLRTLRFWRDNTNKAPEYEARTVTYYSDRRMDGFASAMIMAVGVTMLITPIWVLQAMGNFTMKLVVITAFVLVFLLILSFAMASKPFEALGATAAYAAVLMVFIQVGTGGP